MFTYSLFASQLVAIGAWEHHCSLPASFRSLSAGCLGSECSFRLPLFDCRKGEDWNSLLSLSTQYHFYSVPF
ncbi:hypothetical protein V8C86DRAFT_2685773 [Haematococcus lacustris]